MLGNNYLLSSNAGEGSSSSKPSGGVIGAEDFSYNSESDTDKVPSYSNQPSQEIGDKSDVFKKKIQNMTEEEISTTKENLQAALIEYESSGTKVPAYHQEVQSLKNKLEICDNKLLELENENKSKGKEIVRENIEESKSKGKERASEHSNVLIKTPDVPRSYSPVSDISDKGEFEDYYASNSEDEEKAIQEAIERSLNSK